MTVDLLQWDLFLKPDNTGKRNGLFLVMKGNDGTTDLTRQVSRVEWFGQRPGGGLDLHGKKNIGKVIIGVRLGRIQEKGVGNLCDWRKLSIKKNNTETMPLRKLVLNILQF